MQSQTTLLSLIFGSLLAGHLLHAASQNTGQPGGLTLRSAVERALSHNPLIRVTAAGQNLAAAQLSEARAGRLPKLEFNETFTNSNNPVYVFGSLLEQGRFTESNFQLGSLNQPGSLSNFRSSLNLRVPLFSRFQISSGIAQAQIRQEQANGEADWVAQQVRMQVIEAYYGLLVAGERRAVAADSVKTAVAEVENIRSKVDMGIAVTSDLLAMEVQLADFRQQLVQAEGDERTALAALNTSLSLSVETPQALAGSLTDRQFQVGSLADLVSTALENRPDFQNAVRQTEIAQRKVQSARGSYWPDLNLFAQVGQSSQNLSNGSADFAVGASLNFDLVDFGRGARIRQSLAASDSARAQQDQTRDRIRMEVVQAFQRFLSSRERLQLASTAVDQAVEALRIVEDRLDVGLTTVTEVLRAQTALLKARFNLSGARYDHYLGYAGILLATGSLLDVNQFSN